MQAPKYDVQFLRSEALRSSSSSSSNSSSSSSSSRTRQIKECYISILAYTILRKLDNGKIKYKRAYLTNKLLPDYLVIFSTIILLKWLIS